MMPVKKIVKDESLAMTNELEKCCLWCARIVVVAEAFDSEGEKWDDRCLWPR